MAKQFFIIFLSFFYIKFLSSSQAETHTLTQGQNLTDSDSQYLFSPSNIFVLGFFRPSSSSESRYLGIWYSGRDSDAVWVANRDNPIKNSTGKLTIDGDGNLKILFDGGHLMDLYNQSRTKNKITATLQDDGNFVLKDNLNGTEDRILWQSFDFPSDTLLPGMKLGVNFKTGQKWFLKSWLAKSFPTTGVFTLAGDPNGTSELIIWRREKIYWRSGVWNNDKQSFERALELTSDKRCDFRYVSNENEKYVTYSMKKSDDDSYDTRWVMDPRGVLGFSEEGRIGPCQGKTGSRETFGCVWEISLSDCGRGNEFQFQERNGEIYAYDLKLIKEMRNSSLGFPDCETICRQNCSCLAFTYYRDDVTLCQFYSGDFKFEQTKGGRVFYVDPSLLPSSSKTIQRLWFIIPIVVAIGLAIIVMGICYLRRRNKKIREKRVDGQGEFFIEDGDGGCEVQLLSFESIVVATKNFSLENKLGQGGFGPVYKGELSNGKEIAVKRLSRSSSGQGIEEFRNEIILIAKLQHTNLVRLLGWCVHGEEKMLIYEYLSNKSLDFFLFDPTKRGLLDWKKRFNIIEGIAQGLLYLHKYSRLKIIHRDLKVSNILLDGEMNPKISDFGMARIFSSNKSEDNTSRVVGTYGYMSPEYAMDGIFSVKSDVFSFGVLLLEILSGRRNNSFGQIEYPINLIGYAWKLWTSNCSVELIDPILSDSCPHYQVLRCIQVGLLCVEENAMDRPTMSDVLSMLTNETIFLPSPKQPSFSGARNLTEMQRLHSSGSKDYSINRVSMSVITGR